MTFSMAGVLTAGGSLYFGMKTKAGLDAFSAICPWHDGSTKARRHETHSNPQPRNLVGMRVWKVSIGSRGWITGIGQTAKDRCRCRGPCPVQPMWCKGCERFPHRLSARQRWRMECYAGRGTAQRLRLNQYAMRLHYR